MEKKIKYKYKKHHLQKETDGVEKKKMKEEQKCVDVAKQIQTHKLDILPLEKYQKKEEEK